PTCRSTRTRGLASSATRSPPWRRCARATPSGRPSTRATPAGCCACDARDEPAALRHDRPRLRRLSAARPPAGRRPRGGAPRERVVVLTWDPAATSGFWLVDDYFPEMVAIDREIFPTLEELRRSLGRVDARPLLVPHDCVDGFLGAYWRRPQAYLDAGVRGAISTFTKLADVEPGLARLRADLADGTWERRHGHLRARHAVDLRYRLVVAERTARGRN